MSEYFLYEMYGIVRRKNSTLLLNPLSVRYEFIKKISEDCLYTIKDLKKTYKKGREILSLQTTLLYSCLLIGMLIDHKQMLKHLMYYDVYDTLRLQVKRALYFSKKLYHWISLVNYLAFFQTVIGLLELTSFPFENVLFLLKNEKPYNNS